MLKQIAIACLLVAPGVALAVPTTDHTACVSSQEFMDSMHYLRSNKNVELPEEQVRLYADQISKGCTGAYARFKDVFEYLNKMGVDHRQSLKIAMSFSPHTDTVKNTFLEILKGSYLREYYDVDFKSALQLAYDISMDHRTTPERLRTDFVGFVRFCNEKKGMEVPLSACVKYSRRLLELTPYFEKGAYPSFEELFIKLNTDKAFGISIRESLEVSLKVLSFGPQAPENFLKGYAYALDTAGLGLSTNDAVQFGLRMASRSVTQMPPPVVGETSRQSARGND